MGKTTEILIINGSPRKNKNCNFITNVISSKLKEKSIEYKVFNIYDMNIEYCNACGFCEKTGYCRIKDEMTSMYEMFNQSKGTIIISPIYFDSVSAKVKTVVDRTQAFYASKYVLKKPSIDRSKKRLGMYISVGGAPSYDTQFKGGQIVMDFFFKSINTKLKYNLYLNKTDETTSQDNLEFRQKLDENLEEYIKGLVTE